MFTDLFFHLLIFHVLPYVLVMIRKSGATRSGTICPEAG